MRHPNHPLCQWKPSHSFGIADLNIVDPCWPIFLTPKAQGKPPGIICFKAQPHQMTCLLRVSRKFRRWSRHVKFITPISRNRVNMGKPWYATKKCYNNPLFIGDTWWKITGLDLILAASACRMFRSSRSAWSSKSRSEPRLSSPLNSWHGV